MELNDLYNEIPIPVYSWDNIPSKALILRYKDRYGIFMDYKHISTTAEEKVILAHEYGHYMTGTLHPIGSPWEVIAQHEYKADKFAFLKLCPADEIIDCAKKGMDVCEIAEHLGVTQEFLLQAHEWYKLNRNGYANAMERIGGENLEG